MRLCQHFDTPIPIFVFPRKKESHKYVFMKKKELLKQLIVNFQHSLPAEVYPRTLVLPTDSGKIITVPDYRNIGCANHRLNIHVARI